MVFCSAIVLIQPRVDTLSSHACGAASHRIAFHKYRVMRGFKSRIKRLLEKQRWEGKDVSPQPEPSRYETSQLQPLQLEDLPPEIKLRILGFLTFKALTAARSLNSHFQNLIELKENHAFFKPKVLVQPTLSRLRKHAKLAVWNYYGDTLRQPDEFLNNRGMWLDESYLEADLEDFCDRMALAPKGREGVLRKDFLALVKLQVKYHSSPYSKTTGAAKDAPGFFKKHEYQSYDACYFWCDVYSCRHLSKAHEPFHRLGHQRTKQRLYYQVRTRPGVFRAKFYEPSNEMLVQPLTPITRMHSTKTEFQSRAKGLCSVETLCSELKVPRIEERLFAYYVRSEWAYEKVKDVVTNGSKLKPREKLKVLQDMFIC